MWSWKPLIVKDSIMVSIVFPDLRTSTSPLCYTGDSKLHEHWFQIFPTVDSSIKLQYVHVVSHVCSYLGGVIV